MVDISTALYVLALILAIVAAIRPTFYLLNVAVVCVCIGLVLQSGFIRS